MFVQRFLPRFLIFLGSCVSFAVIDLGGVFEADVVKHVARDMVCSVGELQWESINILEFHFGILGLEYLLEGKAINAVSDSGHDRAREEVTHKCRCSCFFKSGWFRDSNFLWSWWWWNPWECVGSSDWRGRVQNVISSAFVYGHSFMWVYQYLF